MIPNDIYLGPSGSERLLSMFGRKFNISPIELKREDRTADGTLVQDIYAKKNVFTLNYSIMDQSTLDDFQDLYDLETSLSLKVRNNSMGLDSYTVIMRPFARDRFKMLPNALWGNVTVILEQV